MRSILLIFIRNPVLGKVKTRLASSVGDAEALRVYQLLLERTRRAASGFGGERWLFYSDFVPAGADAWPGDLFQKYPQAAGALGERLEAAFHQAFEAGAGKVLVIGSDCPALDAALLEQAEQALDAADVVIGPTFDGGYYLLGLRQPSYALFQDIAWSTELVRAQTEAKAQAAGLRVALLPTLADIDTEADLLAANL